MTEANMKPYRAPAAPVTSRILCFRLYAPLFAVVPHTEIFTPPPWRIRDSQQNAH